MRLQLADRAGFLAALDGLERLAEQHNSWLLRALGRLWRGLEALLDGDPDEANRMADSVLTLTSDHNFIASAGGLALSAHRWRGSVQSIADGYSQFAEHQPGLPVAASIAATVAALAGYIDPASALVERLVTWRPIVTDDSQQSGLLASLTEACVLTGRTIPDEVMIALRPYTGQILVMSWGADVLGAADRFIAIAAATSGNFEEAAAAFTRAANLEAQLSSILPVRTHVWRHALLGDIPAPEMPPTLLGLELEQQCLRTIRPNVDMSNSPPSPS